MTLRHDAWCADKALSDNGDPLPMTIPEIAAKLTEAQRALWIDTVLTVVASEPQRRAFIAGYNDEPPPLGSSQQMHRCHQIGLAVVAHLQGEQR